jgi:hypothetical protein
LLLLPAEAGIPGHVADALTEADLPVVFLSFFKLVSDSLAP